MTSRLRGPALRWCLAICAATVSALLLWAFAKDASSLTAAIIGSVSAIAMAIAFRVAFGWSALSLLGSTICFCAVLVGEGWLDAGYVDPLFLVIGLPLAFLYAAGVSTVVFYVSRPAPRSG